MYIAIISVSIFFAIVFLLTIYAWLNVKIRANRKVSYEMALRFELKQIKDRKITWDISQYNFNNVYQSVLTRYGNVDIYKFGDGPNVVIFVHGILSNSRSSIKILNYFLSRNFTVIAYDNFGWGKSRSFGTTKFGKNEAFLLHDIIEFTKKHLEMKQLIIYGESMGGATIYNYLNIFKNKEASRYIINAGYISFLDNVMKLGKKQLWYFVYLTYLPLLFIFWLERWPIKPLISKKTLQTMDNVYHIHSLNDKLVSYDHIKKYLGAIKHHHIYKDASVRHVLGWYDANKEHYQVLDSWIKE